MKIKTLTTLVFTLLYACTPSNNSLEEVVISAKRGTTSTKKIKPNWGYRFKITGDFDGDGKQEKLTERFYSQRDRKETNKFYHSIHDLEMSIDSSKIKRCKSFLICTDLKIDTFFTKGMLGLRWLKNEGDLDQDGGEELSFAIVNSGDFSKTHCFIFSFKNGAWHELHKFDIQEDQLPHLPGKGNLYLETGEYSLLYEPINDSLNQERIKSLNNFPGFITKLKDSKISIRTQDARGQINTSIVDLKK
jgi:hypothetical protein